MDEYHIDECGIDVVRLSEGPKKRYPDLPHSHVSKQGLESRAGKVITWKKNAQ